MVWPRRLAEAVRLVRRFGFFDDTLPRFYDSVGRQGDAARIAALALLPEGALRGRLATIAADIQEMRPFLVRKFRPAKTAVSLPGGGAVAWDWILSGHAIGRVYHADTPTELLAALRSEDGDRAVPVGGSGLFLPPEALLGEAVPTSLQELATTHYVLDLLRDRLLLFYTKVDLQRIREAVRGADEVEALSDASIALDLPGPGYPGRNASLTARPECRLGSAIDTPHRVVSQLSPNPARL